MGEAANQNRQRRSLHAVAGTKQRKKLGDLRAKALSTAPELKGVVPEDVLVYVLDRTYGQLRWVANEVDDLKEEQRWVWTDGGEALPHHAMRLEAELRQEAVYITAKMLGLEIDNRRAAAAEKMAELLAPVFKEVLEGLKLTAAQKKRVPGAIRGGLLVLEGGIAEKTAA